MWLTSLDSRIGEGDSIISIANDLAQVTNSKTLYGGDMIAAARLLRQMALKMSSDLQVSSLLFDSVGGGGGEGEGVQSPF